MALAVASLFAVWFDVDEPVRFVATTYTALVIYVVYSLGVAVALWRAEAVPPHWSGITHATDLAYCSLLIFCTEGPSSPFNSWFVFALLSATLRWRARGTLWTAGVVLVAFVVSTLYFSIFLVGEDFDMRAVIIRGVYLVVLAALLHYVGTQNQRTLREMWGLAEWPHHLPPDVETLTKNMLTYAADLMEAPHVVLRWSQAGVVGIRCASWNRGRWSFGVDEPSGHEASVSPSSRVIAPLRGESCQGHLQVLGTDATIDNQVLAEIVADVIAGRLDSFYLADGLRLAAATDERVRLARDLHDGVLQSFTGIGLRLAAIQRLLTSDRVAALAAVEDVQRVLASEQRSLRFFIHELHPASPNHGEEASLATRLRDLARLMELEWDLHVELQVTTVESPLSASLTREVYHIIREALINAVRHGGASSADVIITSTAAEGISLTITDNGRGFPVAGHFTADELSRRSLGPRTLRERVEAINGDLSLQSGSAGATLHVILPHAAT